MSGRKNNQTTISLVEFHGKRLRLNLHAGQLRAWDSNKRFVFMIAGAQSGKTSFGPWWLLREIKRMGPGDYLAVTSTYDLFKLKMLPEMIRVFCDTFSHEGWTWRAVERVIEKPGVRIILRSAEAEGGLESATALAAWLDECGQNKFRIEAWDAILRRLAIHGGRVLGTTTPYNLGWLKREIYDRWSRGDDNIDVIQFDSVTNPIFPRDEFDRLRETMPAWKFSMFYRGLFEKPEWLIYSDMTDDHIVESFAIPPEWPRIIGIDFGAIHTATVWIAQSPSGVWYVYRETLSGNMTTSDHVSQIKAMMASDGVQRVRAVGGSRSESQQRMDWGSAGLHVEAPKVADVEAQIDRVIALLKKKKLMVFRGCSGLLDEFGGYSRVIGDDGVPTEKIADKEQYHRLDALRYAVSAVTERPGMIHQLRVLRGG